jgi:predicted ATPase
MSADSFSRRTFPRLTSWCLGEKTNGSADIFSGLDAFNFHLDGDFYSTDNFDNNVRNRLDKILRIMILEKYNERNEWLAANKNYMSSLAAEGLRNVVLASAVYRQTVCRSEFQPCI